MIGHVLRRLGRWVPALALVAAVVAALLFRRRRRRGGAAVESSRHVDLEPRPTGTGVVVAVNPRAGTAGPDVASELRRLLPDATVLELSDPDELVDTLEASVTGGARVVGVAGGDGSANAAARVAVAHSLPLLVVPAGSLNHLARDLGVTSVEDAAQAVAGGTAVEVDVADIEDRLFLNTASFGSYSELVDLRERLEDRIGKWPAHLLATAVVLRRGRPVEVELDGVHRSLWMIFIGNCRYQPDGFAPTRRPRLDDGQLDVRIVDASHPWYRTRLVVGLLTGRLGRSPMYDQWATTSLAVRAAEPLRLASDGETFDGGRDVIVAKDGRRLAVYA